MSDIVDKSRTSIKDKIKKDPIPIIGLAGFSGIVGYAIYHYRYRKPGIKPSVYVIQARVAAQGLAVTVFTLGLCYHMYQTYKADKIVPADISARITSSEVEKVQKK